MVKEIFLSIISLVIVTPLFLIASFIIYVSNTFFLLPIVIAFYILFILRLAQELFEFKLPKKFGRYMILASLVITVIWGVPEIYDRLIPVVRDGQVILHDYRPYGEDTKTVFLDEQATFTIEDDLPRLDGATALYPVYAAFAQAVYPEKDYAPYHGEVMSTQTGEAYKNLIKGEVDMIFVAGPSKAQLTAAERAGVELKFTPIGKEAFVFFVHHRNPVKSLTVEEIQGIYSGEITNWKDVGGRNRDIKAFQREEDSGSQTALENLMGDIPIMDPPVEDVITLMGTMLDVVSDYKNYPNAIGYTFRYYSTEMVGQKNIRLLEINGIAPNVENIRSDQYPITGEFYVVTAGSDNPHIDDFIDWILSEQGQEIIKKTGYVPLYE